MLKELSELRRIKEKKALQMKDIIDKAEEYIRTNPPQLSVYALHGWHQKQQLDVSGHGGGGEQV